MKSLRHILAVMVLAGAVVGTAWPVENPSVRNPSVYNPAGIGSIPPSSYGRGLYRSPNPIDRGFDLVITGNIRGGKRFQGGLGYSSPSSLDVALGSSALDSFLRDSASSRDFGLYKGKYGPQPFYSPSQTVTGTLPGLSRSGVYRPGGTRLDDRASDILRLEPLRKPASRPETSGVDLALPSIPGSGRDLGLPQTGLTPLSPGTKASVELYRQELEMLKRTLSQKQAEAGGLRAATPGRRAQERQELLGLLPDPRVSGKPWSRRPGEKKSEAGTTDELGGKEPLGKLREMAERPDAERAITSGKLDAESLEAILSSQRQVPRPGVDDTSAVPTSIEQIKQRIAELEERIADMTATDTSAYGVVSGRPASKSQDEATGLVTRATKAVLERERAAAGIPTTSMVEQVNRMSEAEITAEAREAMGPYRDYEAYSRARFQECVGKAELYLKRGQFYRASEQFSQALIYNSDAPDAYAGKSLALFAAGEYMSSALFLRRAIDASKEYVKADVDLVAMVGADMLDRRIKDAEEWLERSLAPELEFVLSYMYYRLGRLDDAKKGIDSVLKRVPDSRAARVLKDAIYEALGSAASEGR